MGLFGSKKTTTASTSVVRMIDDEHLPNVIKQGVVSYIFSDAAKSVNVMGDSLSDYINTAALASAAVKWNTTYRYAIKEGKYYYGTPKGTLVKDADFTQAPQVQETIEHQIGSPITMLYSIFDQFYAYHNTWYELQRLQQYNPATNKLAYLSSQLGVDCFLQQFQIHYSQTTIDELTDAKYLEQLGVSSTFGATQKRTQDLTRAQVPYVIDPVTVDDFAQVTYTFRANRIVEDTTVVTTVTTKVSEDDPDPTVETNTEESTDTSYSIQMPEGFVRDSMVSSSSTTDENTETSTSEDGLVTTEVKTTVVTTTEIWDFFAYFKLNYLDFQISNSVDLDEGAIDEDTPDVWDPNAVFNGDDSPWGDLTFDPYADYFQVGYTYVSGTETKVGFFTYEYGKGTYPELEGIVGTELTEIGEYYPRFYARLDDRLDRDELADTEPYITSRKTFKKLGMDWLDWVNAMHETISNLDKVKQVYLFLGLPLNTENALEQRYLWQYFQRLYDVMDSPLIVGGTDPVTGNPTNVPQTEVNAKEGQSLSIEDKVFKQVFRFDSLGYNTLSGKHTEVGIYSGGYAGDSANYHYYRYQKTETEYVEVRIWGAQLAQMIGSKDTWSGHESENLLLPLDRSMRKEFGPRDKELIVARAMHIVVNTLVTIKKKWYQTGIFNAAVTIVSIALAWWTAGASLTWMAALQAAAVALATQLGLQLANKYLFSKIGGFFGTLVLVAALVAAAYAGYLGSTGTTGPMNVTAQNMIAVSNAAFTEVNLWTKSELAKINNSMAKLQDLIREQQAVLEGAQDLLNTNQNLLDPTTFLLDSFSMFPNIGESPDEYFNRTIHGGNVGIAVFDFISSYHDMTLTLPDFRQTMSRISGGFNE